MKSLKNRFAWYHARLAAMGPAEIVYRTIEVVSKQTARRYNTGWEGVKAVGNLAILPEITNRLRAGPADVAILVAHEANNVRAGHFNLLGARWPEPSAMPLPPHFWHLDPDDSELFAQRDAYCFDVSFRHGIDTREIKRIWELSRLQFIVPLAADAVLTNNRHAAGLAVGLIVSWMEGNPPFRGLNWVFGIELALRVISVALALSIIGIEQLNNTERCSILRFFFAHVDWIRRFPSLHSSANNHRIAELAGLVIGTTMAPDIPGAATIRHDSWNALLVEMDRQIHPDGVGAEQSPGYTAFSIELFLMAATAYGRERSLPRLTASRLSAWAEHSLWLMDSDGRVPAIGDFDDCRAVATTQASESRYVASIVAGVASCVGRLDLSPPAKDPSIRDAILGSVGTSPAHRGGMRSFPNGGYSIIRSADKTPVVLIFDHGPVGYLSIAAHGHADALAVWLSVGSQPVIVDAGTFLYHSSEALRNRFRATAVHNTLTFRNVASSRASGPFNWATKASSRLVASGCNPNPRIVAEHNGYVSKYGVRHRRTVEFDGISHFTIIDELLGMSKIRSAIVSFLLDPGCQGTLEEGATSVLIAANQCPIARLVSRDGLKARIVRGDEILGLGWVSPSFGVRVPADQILFEGDLKKPSMIAIEVFARTPEPKLQPLRAAMA